MTLEEMRIALGLKDSSGLRKAIERGKLTGELVGKTYIVPDGEVERYRIENLGKRGRPPKQTEVG